LENECGAPERGVYQTRSEGINYQGKVRIQHSITGDYNSSGESTPRFLFLLICAPPGWLYQKKRLNFELTLRNKEIRVKTQRTSAGTGGTCSAGGAWKPTRGILSNTSKKRLRRRTIQLSDLVTENHRSNKGTAEGGF